MIHDDGRDGLVGTVELHGLDSEDDAQAGGDLTEDGVGKGKQEEARHWALRPE